MNEYFDSAVRSSGDLAGVFEFDGEAGYFYLYETGGREGNKIIGSINIKSSYLNCPEDEIEIVWSFDETITYLSIENRIYAIFDLMNSNNYAGNYDAKEDAVMPHLVSERIQSRKRDREP